MKRIREKDKSLFLDKFICLCNGLEITGTQRIREELSYGMVVEKAVCTFEEDADFNLTEERKAIKRFEGCNIFTNEDLFILSLNPKTNIYLYSEEDDIFVVDNLDIVGQCTFISEDEICSTNLVSPSFAIERKNFVYFKEFVLGNRTVIEDFEIVYSTNDFQVNLLLGQDEKESILHITNVSKKMIYPFVMYILSKVKTENDFMENYKVVAGEIVRQGA